MLGDVAKQVFGRFLAGSGATSARIHSLSKAASEGHIHVWTDDRSMEARLERLARAETLTVAMVRASPIRKPVTVDDASLTTAPVTGSRREFVSRREGP